MPVGYARLFLWYQPRVGKSVGAVFCLHDPAEIETLLADAGFHDINVELTTKTLVSATASTSIRRKRQPNPPIPDPEPV